MAEGLGGLGLGSGDKGRWGQLGGEGPEDPAEIAIDGGDAGARQKPSAAAADGAAAAPDISRWVIVYPCYINSKLSIAEGRKLPKAQCCEDPLPAAMAQVAAKLGFQAAIEPRKTHPRDFFHPGRIRVRLFDELGAPVLAIENRRALYREVAKLVPTVKIVQPPSQRQPAAKSGASGSGSSGASSSGKAGGKGKGKGKKKGKR